MDRHLLDVPGPVENVTTVYFIPPAREQVMSSVPNAWDLFILALNMNGPGQEWKLCGVSVSTAHSKD